LPLQRFADDSGRMPDHWRSWAIPPAHAIGVLLFRGCGPGTVRPHWLGRGVVGACSSQAAVMIHRSERSSLTASSVAHLATACDSRHHNGVGDESVPPAGRLILADAIREGSYIDRLNAAPLGRFFPLQRSLVAPRCPEQPATGRSRFGVGAMRRANDLSL
jgi:hypothetical protein